MKKIWRIKYDNNNWYTNTKNKDLVEAIESIREANDLADAEPLILKEIKAQKKNASAKDEKKAAKKALEKLELFDVYRGAQVAAGKKSVAFSLSLRAADHTLTDKEADEVIQNILKALEAEYGATLRAWFYLTEGRGTKTTPFLSVFFLSVPFTFCVM